MKPLVLFLVFAVAVASAQFTPPQPPAPAPADTLGWNHKMIAGLTATQVSYTDWAQGGENALAWTVTFEGGSSLEAEASSWANSYKFAYGNTKLGAQGVRKTDDQISLESAYTLKLGTYVNPYVAATLKTQFTTGYTYAPDGSRTAISDFFDPAFLTQSAGVAYQPVPEVKTRLGAALREILTSNFTNYSNGKKTETDGGVESVTEIDTPIWDNVVLKAKLEMFAPFRRFSEVVVRSDNTLAAKINKYLSAGFNVQLIQERRISARTQVKQSIALSLSYVLF
jgi:hypothetical protein